MKFVINWTPLRICVRSRSIQPHLKVESKELELKWFVSRLFDIFKTKNLVPQIIAQR